MKLLTAPLLAFLLTAGVLAEAPGALAQAQTVSYTPSPQNEKAREWFADAKFGLFIHWGPFSIPGDGEWVMNNRNISVRNYTRLEKFFNPIDFDAHTWVSLAKAAGMKYITLITRHHDGFSMWNTQYSSFNIMNTPYKKDIVRLMADECHRQGIKLFLYYSLLDWRRDDYSWWTGRTGQGTGRTVHGHWEDYIQFMKNQLTELLTHYGEIGGIWFDGYWDQMAEESKTRKDNDVRVDWHIREIYDLIHRLQPQCLIGNNHHMTPLPGEDFQMFEQDVPGENTSGLSFQQISNLPLETCATINNSWGFNITDTTYKTPAQIVALLVKSAGNGGNLLLNIGPMPNGEIQPEFVDRLHWMGHWLARYGESIYHTRGGYIRPQKWGCLTRADGKLYVHILQPDAGPVILSQFPYAKIDSSWLLNSSASVTVTRTDDGSIRIEAPSPAANDLSPDVVVVLKVEDSVSIPAVAQQNPPTTLRAVLLEQFRETWVDQDWFVPVMKALDGVTAKQAMWKPADSAHSIGELAYHLWFWNKEQLDKFYGRKTDAFSGNNNETFTAFTEESWATTVKNLNEVMQNLENVIKTADEEKLKKWASAFDHINTHTAYHTGQILYVRKLQGVWDSNKGVK